MSNIKMSAFSVSSYSRVSTLDSMFWSSCSRFTCCLCRLKSLRILKSTPQNAVDFARIHGTLNKITAKANDGVAHTARAKRISRTFTCSKKNIKFVYQSGGGVSTFANFKWHQQATCQMYGIDWPSRLLRFVTIVHLPFSVRALYRA